MQQIQASGTQAIRPDLTVSNGASVTANKLVVGKLGHSLHPDWPSNSSASVSITGENSTVSSLSEIEIVSQGWAFGSWGGNITVADSGTLSAPSMTINSHGSLTIGGYHDKQDDSKVSAAGHVNVADINMPSTSGVIHFTHTDDNYIFSSNISGSEYGYIDVEHGTTSLTGDNSNYHGGIIVDSRHSVLKVTEQKNLGDGLIIFYNRDEDYRYGGTLDIHAGHDWTFINPLESGWYEAGVLAVDTGGNRFAFKSADLTEGFSGTLALGNTQYELSGTNTAALEHTQLRAGQGSVVTLGDGRQTFSRFAFDGGTVIFGDIRPGQGTAQSSLHTTGNVAIRRGNDFDFSYIPASLDIAGSGTVQVNPSNLTHTTPVVAPDIPLLAQDDGNAVIRLAGTDGTVTGSGANLTLTDLNGVRIADGVTANIVQNGTVAATGTWDWRLTSGEHQDGLYINYGLTNVELLTAGADALVLNAEGRTGNAADLSARLTGSGDLAITGQRGEVVSLSGSSNNYTGLTDVRSGTLAMAADNALGNTAAVTLATGSGLAMNGHSQTTGRLDAAAGSQTDLGGGALTLTEGGTVAGTLTGSGHLNVTGGTLTVRGANAGLSALTTIAQGAGAVLDTARGLGRGAVALAGTLDVQGAQGTLANSLSGAGTLSLTDSRLALGGDNSGLSGDITVDSHSTLTAGSAAALGRAAVANTGELVLSAPSDWMLANRVSGTGNLVKAGPGSVTLTAESAGLTGTTDIREGALMLGRADSAVTLAAGQVNVAAGSSLSGYGGVAGNVDNRGTLRTGGDDATAPARFTVGGDLHNSGQVALAGNRTGAGNELVVNGDYTGKGGTLYLNTVLGGDDSATDRLTVNGSTAGTTAVSVTGAGGSGAQTLDGIKVIHVAGESAGEFTQDGRIVAGAYDYALVRGQAAEAGNWYLTSAFTGGTPGGPDPVNPGTPGTTGVLRPEAGSYAATLAAANDMFITRRHERSGEQLYINPQTGETEKTRMWMRNEGAHNRSRAGDGQLKTTDNRYVLQLGGELAAGSRGSDRWSLGAMAGYGHSNSTTHSVLTGNRADGSVSGYSAGLYGGWEADEVNHYGPYVDGWMQYSWFTSRVSGQGIAGESWKSSGLTASLETGYTWSLGKMTGSRGGQSEWLLQPQAQVTWTGVKADAHQEANGTTVRGEGDGNIRTRLGLRTMLSGHSALDNDTARQFRPYAEVNWLHNTQTYGARLNGVSVKQQGTKNIAELKVGVEGQLTNRLLVWGNIGEQVGDRGYSDTRGMVGVKVNF